MPRYTLALLGMEISFATDAGEGRVHAAKALVEKQYEALHQGGRNVSKEMLLAVVALSLADDFLQSRQQLGDLEGKVGKLLEKIDWTKS